MKLSIITINLNNRDGLQKTIDSVIGQTFRDFEWIVIDGGSTDGSKELIEQYSNHFSYWVSEPDKGIYNAMNKGIKEAKGEYLQFLNSGDWLYDQTALERCFAYCINDDIAYGDLFLVTDGVSEPRIYPDHLTLRFFMAQTLCHNATFIRKELLQSCFYNEHLKVVSDWEFFFIQILKGKSFKHIQEFVVFYDMNGLSSTNVELVFQERKQVINSHIPKTIIEDYRKMDEEINEMRLLLNSDRVKKVIKYSKQNCLYRKMITGCLRIISWIER